MDLMCFDTIMVRGPDLKANGRTVSTIIETKGPSGNSSFELLTKYQDMIHDDHLPLLRLGSAMPLMNYTLFTKKLELDFQISKADMVLLKDLSGIFARDIFVNKLLRRRANYILSQYLPSPDQGWDSPVAKIVPKGIYPDTKLSKELDPMSCGILSSGGKESLLTYGLLNEIGAKVHPFYINESGGHWRTALTGYRYHNRKDPNTARVWSNIDRFYVHMLDNLALIRNDHRRVRADTYPLRLCIFPVYLFHLLPLFAKRSIGNVLIGSEFDDPRTPSIHNGIPHYFGVYDQTQDFDMMMESWYSKRMPGMRQWSAVRWIGGLVVQDILVQRYPELSILQRSCHSCNLEGEDVYPCGKCTKCMGIQLFLAAGGHDPSRLGFSKEDSAFLVKRLTNSPLRLDKDELEHCRFLASKQGHDLEGSERPHVQSIHHHPYTANLDMIPEQFRTQLLNVLSQYTNSTTELKDGKWMPIKLKEGA